MKGGILSYTLDLTYVVLSEPVDFIDFDLKPVDAFSLLMLLLRARLKEFYIELGLYDFILYIVLVSYKICDR